MDKVLLSELIRRIKKRTKYVGDCWIFDDNSIRPYGYLSYRGKIYNVSRISACYHHNLDYEDTFSQALHRCPNKKCWNPEHIYVGDNFDNMKDKAEEITHCPQGHKYSGENVRTYRGARICKECDRVRKRAEYASKVG